MPFVVAAIILIVVGRMRGLRFLVLAVISVVIADAMGTHIFKYSFLRPRPCIALEDVRLLVGCTNLPSFPSNHAVNASVLATLAILYMPRLWLPAAALVFLVGYSRVYVGVHYPLDVLAGSALGIVVAMALSAGMNVHMAPVHRASQTPCAFSPSRWGIARGPMAQPSIEAWNRHDGRITQTRMVAPDSDAPHSVGNRSLAIVDTAHGSHHRRRPSWDFSSVRCCPSPGRRRPSWWRWRPGLYKLRACHQTSRRLHLPLLLPMAAFYLASVLASATAVDPWLASRISAMSSSQHFFSCW